MPMPNSTRVQLVVDALAREPQEVTRLIGLEPAAMAEPEQIQPGESERKRSWIFPITMPRTESIEGQALALLRFLETHADKIQQTIARHAGSIAIEIQSHNSGG